ncbi:MAG: DUF3035 domain-containing protein [Proteobacteria bacterium]|nr:DUF3035 domain-containing protein [Pseudomonadota bacterium]
MRGPHPGIAIRLRGPGIVALLLCIGLGLSACGETRKALGLDKAPPDEFKIVARAPLSLPPDYGLRPPQPGAARPQEASVPQAVRQAVVGSGGARRPAPGAAVEGVSPGEGALLARVGVNQAEPDIRQTVDREATALAQADETFLDRLIFWRKPEEPGTVVDAGKETQRLRENAALGKSASDGDTPSIKRRKKGILEGVF